MRDPAAASIGWRAGEWMQSGMAKRLTITFPSGRDHHYYSRILDFGEALYRPVVHAGLGKLCDLDQSTQVVWIELADSHHLGKVKSIVHKQLDRFQLTNDAVISVD